MRKINTLRNPRIITFFLLFLTFGLAIIAVVTAINLQKKENVNPTPSKAASACDALNPNPCIARINQCAGASECEGNTWCQNDPTCAANCTQQRADCNASTAACTECSAGGPVPTADSCNRQPIDSRFALLTGQGWPACWAGNNARAAFGVADAACSDNAYRKSYMPDCDGNPSNNPDTDWTLVPNPTSTPRPVSTSTPIPTPTTPNDWADSNAKCRYEQGVNAPCNPSEFLADGGLSVGKMAYCRNETGVTSPKAGGGTWVYGNPVPGGGPLSCQANCTGLTGYISGTDPRNTATCNNPYVCNPPGNTPTPGPTNTPSPSPTSTPVPQPASANVSAVCTDGTELPSGSLTLKATVNDFATKSSTGSVDDISIDFSGITFDAAHPTRQITLDAGNTSSQGNYRFSSYTCTNGGAIVPGGSVSCVAKYTGCRGTTTTTPYAVCNNIRVEPATSAGYPGGVKITANTYGRDGATYNYRVKVSGVENSTYSWTSNNHSETRNGTVDQAFGPSTAVSRTNANAKARYNVIVERVAGGNYNLGNLAACTATFEIPATPLTPQCVNMYIDSNLKSKQLGAGQDAIMTMVVANPNAASIAGAQAIANMYNGGNLNSNGIPNLAKVNNINSAGYAEQRLIPGGAGTQFLGNGVVNGNAITYQWKVSYAQLFQNDQNFNNTPLSNIQINGIGGGMTNSAPACVVRFLKTTPPPVCTGLTVTPSTNIKQGDTLSVKVNTSDATGVKYRLDSNFGYNSGATGTYQDSSNFSVAIPTTTQLSAITLTGTVFRDGQSSSQNCNFSYTFTPGTEIEKDIVPNGPSGSTGLGGTAPHYIVEPNDIVKYNVKVKNSGQNVMQNLIVVDRLSAYDPATGAAISTPFGDIQSATNLARTTGTQSTPQTVGPRVPSGNGPYAAGVKSVEWTKIDKLFPTEEYTGTLDVKILAFSGTPILKNTVCLYQDTNNNGQYDAGVDRELDCDHELIYTAQPQFTVVKSAIDPTTSANVGVLEPGKKFKYQITLTNTASTDLNLEGVTITDTFDSEFLSKFNITDISDGGTRNNNIVTWSDLTGTVAPNGTKVVSFNAEVKADFFTGNENCSETVKNNVMAVNTTPGYTTPQYEISVTVLNRSCRTEFEIVKTVTPGVAAPGETVTYTVEITNRGTKSAPIIKIVDDYADAFTYQADTTKFVKPDGGTFDKNPVVQSGTLVWEFGASEQVTLAPTQTLTFTYKMTASQTAGTYPNTVCLENPSGGCDDAVVIIQTQPNTGITTTGVTRIIGFGFMAGSLVLWFIINKKKSSMNYNTHLRTRRKGASTYGERVDGVARRLRNR